MAATRKPRSLAAAAGDDHLRFLRLSALARLRDAKLHRRKPTSRLPPPSPSSRRPPAAEDGGSSAVMPYFIPVSRLLALRCPQRKKLAAAKSMVLFSPPPLSPDLPVKAVMEFLNPPDMVVAAD